MESSIKQWHKSLLFSCVALALLVQAAPVNAQSTPPDGWYEQIQYVLNEFVPGVGDGYLSGVNVWTNEAQPNLNYELAVYYDFTIDGGTGSGSLSDLETFTSGSFTTSGEHTITLDSPIALQQSSPYYVVLGLTGSGGYGQYGYYSTGGDSYYSTNYTFREDGGDWQSADPLRWAITPITTNQGPGANIAVTDEAGNWTVVDTFVSPNTMTAVVDATDEGPYDMEITVTGGMDPIIIDGTITNSTSDDWDGLCIQLGYGLGEDFELATDGLSFAMIGGNQAVIPDTIPAGDGGSAVFGIHMGASNVFTLRQFAVPEPSSLLLLAFSGLAFVAMGRRRR